MCVPAPIRAGMEEAILYGNWIRKSEGGEMETKLQ